MQQRHKKRPSKPVVPISHGALASTSRHQQQQQQQQQQQGRVAPNTQHGQRRKEQQAARQQERTATAAAATAGMAPAAHAGDKRQRSGQQAQHAGTGKKPKLSSVGAQHLQAPQQHPAGQQQPLVGHHQQQQQQQQKKKKKRKRVDAECLHEQLPEEQEKQQQQQQQAKRKTSSKKPSAAGNAAAGAAAAAAAGGPLLPKKPWHPGSAAAVSSNWNALQQQLKATQQQSAAGKPHKRAAKAAAGSSRPAAAGGSKPAAAGGSKPAGGGGSSSAAQRSIGSIGHNHAVTPVLAMDCEMVGVGPQGERDALARVSVVNACGNVLLDSFVAQREPVVDYRTWVSGVTPQHLLGAPSFEEVQQQVSTLMAGRVLVGHSLKKDLAVLLLSHPRKDIRDTAKYPPFMYSKGGKRKPRALRHLAAEELGLTIQQGQHSSVDDARAALYLYQKHAATWEQALKKAGGMKQLATSNRRPTAKRVRSYGSRAVSQDHMADL